MRTSWYVRLGVCLGVICWWSMACRSTLTGPIHREARRRYQMAEEYYKEKQYDKAEGLYEKALEIDKRHTPSYVRIGMILMSRGRFSQALEHLNKAIKYDRKDAEAWKQLGLCLRARKRYKAARKAFVNSLRLRASYETRVLLVQTLRRLKAFKRARVACLRLIADNPQRAEPHYEMGLVYVTKGDASSAVESFKRAIESDGRYLNAHFEVAKLYLQQGKYRLSLVHLARVIKLNSSHIEARRLFGVARKSLLQQQGGQGP